MFFEKPQRQATERNKRFAENTVNKFCYLATTTKVSLEKQLTSINITLKWLDQLLNRFEVRKAGLQKAQKTLQESALAQSSKSAFAVSTAMSSIIAYLSKQPTDKQTLKDQQALERKKYFIDSMQLAVKRLQARKIKIEQRISKTQPELSSQDNPSILIGSSK